MNPDHMRLMVYLYKQLDLSLVMLFSKYTIQIKMELKTDRNCITAKSYMKTT